MAIATWTELLWQNTANGTAVDDNNAEESFLGGLNSQPMIEAGTFVGHNAVGRRLTILANGYVSTTGTPTLTFQARLGTGSGATTLTGASVGVSAAITSQSGISNKRWELELHLTCRTPGIGSNNCTLVGNGWIRGPTAFASPFVYAMPDSATHTYTIDGSVANYFNLSMTWSAASASNTIILTDMCAILWK